MDGRTDAYIHGQTSVISIAQPPMSGDNENRKGVCYPTFLCIIAGDGVTYVRWGRTVCPQGSDRVYKGMLYRDRMA